MVTMRGLSSLSESALAAGAAAWEELLRGTPKAAQLVRRAGPVLCAMAVIIVRRRVEVCGRGSSRPFLKGHFPPGGGPCGRAAAAGRPRRTLLASGAQSSAPALRERRGTAPGVEQVGADREIRSDFRDGFAGPQQAVGLFLELGRVALIGLLARRFRMGAVGPEI